MRVVIQRVSEASVTIHRTVCASIGLGFMILVGVEESDTDEDVNWLSNKIVNLRIFSDENGLMNLSIKEVRGDILLVSQFTLHADTKKGNRPSFIKAAKPEMAIPIYENFKKQLSIDIGKPVSCGEFGADMQVSLINDGPVTLWIDTKNKS